MSVTEAQEALERWKLARQGGVGDPRVEAALCGFFQSFRPDGQGLERVFEDFQAGRELLDRLLQVYEATAPGWKPADAYFIVSAPQPLADADLRRLAYRHRDSMAEIAAVVGADQLRGTLEAARGVTFVPTMDSTVLSSGVNLQVHEVAADFISSLSLQASDALLLGEAYYGIACDYFLKYYLLWPLYRASSTVAEPFEAYLQLWKHGVQCDFGTPGVVSLTGPVLPRASSQL